MIKNQKGLTVVELLGALALVSLIAIIAWTALSIGLQHTALETGKTKLQQEANNMVATLSAEHRRSEEYYLRFQEGQLQISTCTSAGSCTDFQDVSDKAYAISGSVNKVAFTDLDGSEPIKPKESHVNLYLKVADPLKPSNSVSVNTTLTRILTSQN